MSHPKETDTSEGRGEGFELRTDQWGAVRAGQGLLVSTYKQDQAKGEHLDAEVAKKQLEGSLTNSKALSDIAKNQKTDEIESLEHLKEFAEQLEQKIAKFKKAVLLLNSPDGIALSTAEDIHFSADSQINQIAGDSINFSTQKNWIAQAQNKLSLFAAQGGIKAVAAQSKVEIQAQSDALDIFAKLGITISSTEDRIEISSPKEVLITGGSSQIALNNSGIFPKTGGIFEVKAGQHIFQSGSSVSTKSSLPPPPKRGQGVLELIHDYAHGEFVKGAEYTVTDTLGKVVNGKLDDNGFARVSGLATGSVKVTFEDDQRDPWDPASDFKREVEWPNNNDEDLEQSQSRFEQISKNAQSALGAFTKQLTDSKNLMKNIQLAQQIQSGGAKALLPMLNDQVQGVVTEKISGMIPNIKSNVGIDGIGGFVSTQNRSEAFSNINGLASSVPQYLKSPFEKNQ